LFYIEDPGIFEIAHQPLAPPLLLFPPLTSATAGRHRSPPLQLCRRHLLPLAAPTRRPQAGRRPSPSPLAFSRAHHAAPPLPEHCPAATSPLSWLAPCMPPLALLFRSKTFHSSPSLHFALSCILILPRASERRRRPFFVSSELCSSWATAVSLPLLKLILEQASSSPTGAPRTYPDANPPLDHPTDARRRGSSPPPFGSLPIHRSSRSPPSTSVPPEPHHPGVAHRPYPHLSPISSTPEHRRRSRAPSPPPRVIVVSPPPVDPDLHITPSKVRSSPLILPGWFPLAAGDHHHRNSVGESRLFFPGEPGIRLQ
jgi:hypothetical protein